MNTEQQIMINITELKTELAALKEDLHEIREGVKEFQTWRFGNGQPGIEKRLDRIEVAAKRTDKTIARNVTLLVACVSSGISGAISLIIAFAT